MQLSKLTLDLAPKTSWQCFDLACKLVVTHFIPLFCYWIIITLPIFVVAMYVNVSWGLLLFWLGKPWYERGLLYILSRAVFGAKVSVADTLVNLPAQIKPLWFSSITYRRLSATRSFDMAVAQLENLSGEQRRKRLQILHKTKDDNSAWWTVCCVHWESFICIGIITLIQMLLPGHLDFWDMVNALDDDSSLQSYVVYLTYYVAIAIVAPFYVAGGFVAYLNRRVILEGWDIELGFTKWREAFIEKSKLTGFADQSNFINQKQDVSIPSPETPISTKNLVVSMMLISGIYLFMPNTGVAQSTSSSSIDDAQNGIVTELSQNTVPEQGIQEGPVFSAEQGERRAEIESKLAVLIDSPPFSRYEVKKSYRWKSSDDIEKEEDSSSFDFGFISSVVKFIATSLEFILWGLFLFVFAYLIVRNWESIARLLSNTKGAIDNAPLPSFITNVFSEALPTNVEDAVNQAISAKEYRRALSILVRASFTQLSTAQHIRITKSMTEKECLREIERKTDASIFHYMNDLLNVWMKMAWAHQIPTAIILSTLNQHYSDIFGAAKIQTIGRQTAQTNKDGEL